MSFSLQICDICFYTEGFLRGFLSPTRCYHRRREIDVWLEFWTLNFPPASLCYSGTQKRYGEETLRKNYPVNYVKSLASNPNRAMGSYESLVSASGRRKSHYSFYSHCFLGRWGKVLNCSDFRVLLLEWWLVGNGDMVSSFVSDLGRWGLHPLLWWVLRFLLKLWEKENRHYTLLVSLIFRPNQRKKNKTLPLDSAWLTGVLLWHKILACRKYYIPHIAW